MDRNEKLIRKRFAEKALRRGQVRLLYEWDQMAERTELDETIGEVGSWGCLGQFWDGGEWITADSIWGLYDRDAHDHEADIMEATLGASEAFLAKENTVR